MNAFTLAGMLFVATLLLLALVCLFTGQPWNALFAAITAAWIAKSVDAEEALEAEPETATNNRPRQQEPTKR